MRAATGIEGLDKMLKGGLISQRSILLSGPCGSGKSTIAMQFIYHGAMQYDEPGLYITLEEDKDKFYHDMARIGMDLKKAEELGKFTLIGGPVAELRGYMEKVEAEMKNLIEEIKEVVEEKGIKRVVIDSINLLTILFGSEDVRRNALALLSNTLSSLGCTSILISETKEGSMDLSRYGMEEFVVDGVIVLYLVRQGSKFVPGITVRKMRGSDHDKKIRFYQITDKGIIVHPQEAVFTNI